MSYISVDNLNSIHIELSNYCNAACPMCPRFDYNGNLRKDLVNSHNITLDLIQKRLDISLIKKLQNFFGNGTFGDGAVNPECVEIFKYIRQHNPTCVLRLNTNGGPRNKNFWKDLGSIPNMRVAFHIDGLEDTNHLYRKNVLWHQLIENVSAFINAGGRAGWNMIIFKHNEHQVEEARQLSEKMGFSNFSTHYSARWINRNWVHAGQVDKKERWDAGGYFIEPPVSQPKSGIVNSVIRVFDHQHPINCKVFTDKKVEIYIRANGQVQPCCEVGEVAVHELGELVDNPEDINLHYHSLNDILQGLFFKKIADGISGGPTRLQNCFYHCGHGQDKNYT